MVDVAQVVEVHVQLDALRHRLERLGERREAQHGRGAVQVEGAARRIPVLPDAHLQVRHVVEDARHREADAQQHARQEIHGDDAHQGGRVDGHLLATEACQLPDRAHVDELVAGEDEHRREHGGRNLRVNTKGSAEQKSSSQTPCSQRRERACERRPRRSRCCARSRPSSAARRASPQSRLPTPWAVSSWLKRVRGTVVELVDGRGAEERLRARHEGEGQARDAARRSPSASRSASVGNDDRVGELGRGCRPG